MKKLGHLNIPKSEIERFSFTPDIQTLIYLRYSNSIENSRIGQQVLNKIQEDPRVKKLDGQMISTGSGVSRFEPKVLAMWFLWAKDEFGKKLATEYLNKFLDSQDIPVINTLWVLGVEVEESIQLANGIVLIPITDMPISREKEYFLKREVYTIDHQIPKPKAAITIEKTVIKSYQAGEDASNSSGRDKDFWESSKLLYDISLILNVIQDTFCIPYFSTAYTLSTAPLGVFGGSGGGMPVYDIVGHRLSKITSNHIHEINTVITSFLSLEDEEKERFRRILSRLSQSKRREQIEDKILDLGIALEMALLDRNGNKEQLSLSFRLRGSWLIASDKTERLSIYNSLKNIYNYRSQVAHSGTLDAENIDTVRSSFAEYSDIAERIVKKLICEGGPDWTDLLLGIC